MPSSSLLVRRQCRALKIEALEPRQVLSAATGSLDQLVTPNLVLEPDATSGVSGFTPAQLKAAYGFNGISFGGVTGNGSGQTIAIVDAYNDPNIVSDLGKFDAQFGLAAPTSFKIVNETGGTKLPQNDRGWSSEIALDVEWAHAIAPGANILLVEASSANTSDLDRALDYARDANGVTVVSNSWGGSEYNGESSEDVHFTTPSNHAGVTFTVAAGDDGTGAEYPSSSPDVISVGGSTLRTTSSGAYSSESVWSDGGGGTSRYEGLPSYQNGLGITNRGTPDVSYDANPSTGVTVYDTYGDSGWAEFGGTSAGAPQWAALIAIADQGRALSGKSSLSNAQDVLYTLPKTDFHDITSGSNGSSATTGYDVASGLGTPIASSVVRDLVAYSNSTSFTQAAVTSTSTGRGGFGWGWGWGFGGFTGFGGFFGFDVPAGGGNAAGGAESAADGSISTATVALGDASSTVDSALVLDNGDHSQLALSDNTNSPVDAVQNSASQSDSSALAGGRTALDHLHQRFHLAAANGPLATLDDYFASLDG